MPKRPPPVEEGRDNEVKESQSGEHEKEEKKEESTSEEEFGHIDVDFEFFNPGEEDFHGIKALLNNYVEDEPQWHDSDLVEAIIASPMGSVIKCGSDEDVIGVASILRVSESYRGMQDVKDFSHKFCPDDLKNDLERAWTAESATTGLLISERLINCPPQLAPPLMKSLMEEMDQASLPLRQLLFVTKAFLDPTVQMETKQNQKREKKQKVKNETKNKSINKSRGRDLSELIFTTPEGEYLCSVAAFAFAFPSPSANREDDDEFQPYRVVASIAVDKIPEALDQMSEVVSQV